MASSLTSPALTLAAQKAIIASRPYIAKLSQFANDFSADAVAPMTTLKIAIYDGVQAKAFNEDTNNYETVDGSTKFADVTFSEFKTTFKYTEKDLTEFNNTGLWSNTGSAAGRAIGKEILTQVAGKIGIGAGHSVTLPGTLTKKSFADLRKECATAGIDPADCVVMLNSATFAELLSLLDFNVYGSEDAIKNGVIPNLYGFKAVVEVNAPIVGDDGALKGIVAPGYDVIIATKQCPNDISSAYQEFGYETDPDSGLSVNYRRHVDTATGSSYWNSVVMLGVGFAEKDKFITLK